MGSVGDISGSLKKKKKKATYIILVIIINKMLTGCEATQSFNDREKEWGDIAAARSSPVCGDGRSVIGATDERVLRDVPGWALMPPRDMFTSLPFPNATHKVRDAFAFSSTVRCCASNLQTASSGLQEGRQHGRV